MPKDLSEVLRKLDRPPAGPNWVRFVSENPERTMKAILSFAKGIPPFTYRPGYASIKDRIELGLDKGSAVRNAQIKGSPAGRLQNKNLVEAFFKYDEERKYSAANPIEFDVGFFRVSRDVGIPVAPLSVIREKGVFVPIFVCGWNSVPLSLTQRRLLMTIYEDAFLSLTDFQKSPAEVLFFPSEEIDGVPKRSAEVWKRGDYALLSQVELDRCLENFVLGREAAREVLLREIAAKGEQNASAGAGTSDQPDLFPKPK